MGWWDPGDWFEFGKEVYDRATSDGDDGGDMSIIDDIVEFGLGEVGAYLDDERGEDQFHMNAGLQREFAQMGIQWKVADAIKAGIHPLYALGAQTNSGIPIHIQGGSSQDNFSRLGQNLTSSYQSWVDRKKIQESEDMQKAKDRADIDETLMRTKNEFKRGQLLDMDLADRGGQLDSTSHIVPGKARQMYQKHQIGPGFMMYGPNLTGGESFHEAIESMSNIAFQAMLNYNEAVQGTGWRKQFFDWYYAGVPPGEHFKGDRR